ncbi:MAG: phosphotransferase [Pseudomonadota bacterium]
MTRDDTIGQFLRETSWRHATREALTGDASNRRYHRLTLQPGTSAILMDAPVMTNPDTAQFVEVAEYLQKVGLRSPRIFAKDLERGFLLLEDLGDDVFARVAKANLETDLYIAATDVLLHLHRAPPMPGLNSFSAQHMTQITDVAYEWYAAEGGRPPAHTAVDAALRAALDPLDHVPKVVALRDYHAENLIWLPNAQGTDRVGLLDFQDAVLAHPAYDLASLLQDARRDVPAGVCEAAIDHYISSSGTDGPAFIAALALVGAQRNLRILGVFARLALRDGKKHYVDLIPRVWGHLTNNLSHPALGAVKDLLLPILPEPTSEKLNRLATRCPTTPAH